MKRILAVLLIASVLMTLFAGCGKTNDPDPANTPAVGDPISPSSPGPTSGNQPQTPPSEAQPPAADADLDRDITIVQALDMVSWDPINTSDLSNGYVINCIYSKLFTFDENINGIPSYARTSNASTIRSGTLRSMKT